MRKRKYLLVLVFVFICSLTAFKLTHSYFTDTEKVLGNAIQVGIWGITPTETPSPEIPTSTPTQTPLETPTPTNTPTPTPTNTPTPIATGNIVINEVYNSNTDKAEWIELYNPTTSAIDVSGWKIADKNAYDNGQDDTFPTVSSIPANGYAVVITNLSTVTGIPASAIIIELTSTDIGSGLNADGDAVVLKNSDGIVDAMNYGNIAVFFPSPPAVPSLGSSLARLPNGTDTNTTADWLIDSTPSLGVEN